MCASKPNYTPAPASAPPVAAPPVTQKQDKAETQGANRKKKAQGKKALAINQNGDGGVGGGTGLNI